MSSSTDLTMMTYDQQQQEEDDDIPSTIDFLGPNHALMQPLQKALLDRMMRKVNRISILLKDKEEENRRLSRYREDLGSQLYTFQQQLGTLQTSIEDANNNRNNKDDEVRIIKDKLEGLIQEYDESNKDMNKQIVLLDKARDERNEVLHVLDQLKGYRDNIEGYIALKKREAYKGEDNIQIVEKDKLEQDGHVIKNKYEIMQLKGLIEGGERNKVNMTEEYDMLNKSLLSINNDNNALDGIKDRYNKEYNNIEKDIEKINREINSIGEGILEHIGQETTIDRNTINTIKEAKDVEENNIKKEGDIALAQNDRARGVVDVINIKAHNNVLADRIQELEGGLIEMEEISDKYEEDIIKRMRQIDKKQLMVERLNKEYDDKRNSFADVAAEEAEALGPLEAKIRGLRNMIDECRRKSDEMQKKWIITQSELREINDNEDDIKERCDILNTKIIVLEEKYRRLEGAIKRRVDEGKICKKEIIQLREDMVKINKKIGEYRKKEGIVNNELKDVEGDIANRLIILEDNKSKTYKAVKDSKEKSIELEEELIESERQLAQWEKKIKLEEELQASLDPNVGQSEIGAMKKEIHRMELRYRQLIRRQEEMVKEMTRAVEKRDIIELKYEGGKNDNRNTRIKKDINTNRNILGLQRKLNSMSEAVTMVDVDMKEKEGKIITTTEQIRDLNEVLNGTDEEAGMMLKEVCEGIVRKGRQFSEVVGIQHETRRLEKWANKLGKSTKGEMVLVVLVEVV
ncbi:hypothetical protein FOL47_005553 [Perkinsus chesapeaki]|uniref:Uncharacterized protein n=1 Tax=Perkinsus chesapeaki TaxID=330153 RepID=A0A7J6LX96_PERCH|nr:hypothetical protein FOL47_005553 [Perkinsus chesapeaki]